MSSYGTLIMDAWAMKKSWAHPLVVGYEIKVSRSDFLGDRKWQKYIDYCNEFYFAAPKGLIAPNELPPEVGLIEATVNGKALITRKKAVYRAVEVPESLYRYILMCRATIGSESHNSIADSKLRRWQEWLDDKEQFRLTGLKIRKKISDEFRRVASENKDLKSKIADYDEVNAYLERMGISNDVRHPQWSLQRILGGQRKQEILRKIRSLKQELDVVEKEVESQVGLFE